MWNQIKTVLLLGTLSGLVLAVGAILGGRAGLTFAIIFAVLMNFGMYFWSHKLVLAMYHAKPASKKDYPEIHALVESIAKQMNLPKPALYIIPTETPNAFATGPNPKKAVVACTKGILGLLNHDELQGVLAHELAHVRNRDMLVTTIAATLAAVISYIAQMAQFAAFFGGNRDSESQGNMFSILLLAILSPIIALILQLAISRSREYFADETGAKSIRDSKHLASALQKLEQGCKAHPLQGNPVTSSLFIVNPFTKQGLVSLFSTHPPTSKRIKRLKELQF